MNPENSLTTNPLSEYVIVLHGNAREDMVIKNRQGQMERILKGCLVNGVALWMKFDDIEKAKDYGRKVWMQNKWPQLKKHMMIKGTKGEILFEAHGK